MFIQVVRGKVKDAGAAHAVGEQWQRDLAPGAKGYLGSTSGVAADGTYVVVVRFEDESSARANSDRPEQTAWSQEMSKQFDGPVSYYDCPTVDTIIGGGSDDAGFVQLMIYKTNDVDAARALAQEFSKLGAMRPDIIGGTSASTADGTFVDTNYFTSEAEARQAEKQPMTPEVQSLMNRFGELVDGETEFIDLSQPHFHSA
ncbi:MAG: hypothetical protein WD826_08970 [Actinomycetota bacterium]